MKNAKTNPLNAHFQRTFPFERPETTRRNRWSLALIDEAEMRKQSHYARHRPDRLSIEIAKTNPLRW
jgi:hypothetical protein